MIISRIIQNGLDLSIETNDIPFQYSSNLHMKFVKDDVYKDWTLEGYYALPKTNLVESKEYQLKINSDGTFKLDEKFFVKAGTIQFSFKLVESDSSGANVHLGIVKYLVRNSIGNTSTVLPEDKELWYTLVQQEVQKYFDSNYSEKLNDFNTKYDDVVTKHTEIVETSTEVKKEYTEVVSMKKSVDSSKQLVDNTKKQIDITYDEYKKFATETKTEINNAKQAIVDGKNEINNLAKEKVDEYTQKVTDFNNNYNTKTASLNTKINEIQTQADEIVETSAEQLKENITESKNNAIKQIQNEGQSYQDQINELQKSEALQDEEIDRLKDDVDLKVTQPYLNNNDSTHTTSSDNGALKNIVVKGNTVQNSTKGYQLFDFSKVISDGVNIVDYQKQTITIPAKTNNTGYNQTLAELCPNIVAGTYILSVTCSNSNAIKCIHLLESDKDINFNIACELTDEDINSKVAWYNAETTIDENVISNFQIEKGSTAHDYEPYTGGQPSPNPDYPQEVKGVSEISGKIVGKNLFDQKLLLDIKNLDTSHTPQGLYLYTLEVDETKDVYIKINYKDHIDYYLVSMAYSYNNMNHWFMHPSVHTTPDFKYNSTDHKGKILIGVNCYMSKIKEMLDIIGDIVVSYEPITDYQPYQSQPFNCTLPKPLYRLSDSVYDYIDVDKGEIVRNVGVMTFDGSDDEWLFTNIENYYNDISTAVLTKSLGFTQDILSSASLLIMCDKLTAFPVSKNIWMKQNTANGVSMVNTSYGFTIRLSHSLTGVTNTDNVDSTINKFRAYMQQNPITVYYQLATPTEEPLPSDLQALLQSLKSYYPQTNIVFDTEIEPYINFDYKLNLKSWIEDKDNEAIIYDKQNKEKDKYSSTFFENMFALQRTGEVYTVKFPKWETSHISTGEKLDANAGLVCEPSTKSIKGQNDYANIPLFKTYDVNAYVDDEGVRHVTAIKGDKEFKDEGKVDVFVLGMSYYEKTWEDDQYWYYSRTDMPKDGYTIARECINRDGSIQPFALYSKYVSGDIDGVLYSSKGLQPARTCYSGSQLNNGITYHDNSYNNLIKEGQKKGKFYSAGMICDYKYILTTFYLKYATLNSQSVMTGCVNYTYQYNASIQSEEKHTYFPVTKARADVIEVNSYASVGYSSTNKSLDRSYNQLHRYGDSVKVLRKEAIDDNNVAIYLDVKEPFNTMPVTVADGVESEIYITSMHWKSGFSDDVLDRDGCPCDTKNQLINSKFPMVIQGIECMVGGYETYSNAFMDIVDATGKREVYIQNDTSLLTTNMTTAKTTYKKSPYAIQPTKLNNWNYITRIDFDLENGAFVQTNTGQDGSSTTTGFADGVYVDNASSGQREFLGFGYLWIGSSAGLSCLYADYGVGYAYWHLLARLSINGVGGELTA